MGKSSAAARGLVKRQVRVPLALAASVRHACAALAGEPHLATLGSLVADAIRVHVAELEAAHHEGRAWRRPKVMPRRIGTARQPRPEGDWSTLPFRLPADLDARSKGAAHARGELWTDLVSAALVAHVRRLEVMHNEGDPFPARALPLGRRTGDGYGGQAGR